MSAICKPVPANRWLTLAAAIALIYALAVIGMFGMRPGQTAAHWIGRAGSIAVIGGVLMHQLQIGIGVPGAFGESPARVPSFATAVIVCGVGAIVAGFALGVVGW